MYFLVYDASGAVIGSGQKTVGTADPGTIECTDQQYANPQAYAVSGGAVVAAPTARLLASAKTAQITTLSQAYRIVIQQPVSYLSTTFQADTASQQTLTRCLVAGSVPAGFYWLDANNAQVTMTFAQLQGLASAMLVQGQTAFTKLQTRKASVNGATTVSAVQAVVW